MRACFYAMAGTLRSSRSERVWMRPPRAGRRAVLRISKITCQNRSTPAAKHRHCLPGAAWAKSPLAFCDEISEDWFTGYSESRRMALIVQKYGGTSVGNPDRIKNVAARVAKYRAKGDQVVVVVSAMSGVTDGLIKLARELMPLPSEREMDVLLATGEQTTIALTAIAMHAINV